MIIRFVRNSCQYDDNCGFFRFSARLGDSGVVCLITRDAVEQLSLRKTILADAAMTFAQAEDAIFDLATRIYRERGLTEQGTIVITVNDVRSIAQAPAQRQRAVMRLPIAPRYGSAATVRIYRTCGASAGR